MRKEERLKTIYEVIAPHITRNSYNWRDYLAFAAKFFKYPFDNALLIYAQNPNVTMLANMKQWNSVGRSINSQEKGLAVCIYKNAKLSIDHLFDISQTHGKEINATNWQLDDTMKSEMVKRLAFSHGIQTDNFPDLINILATEAASDNYDLYFQNLKSEMEDHLFSKIPEAGLEAQFIDLLTDSVVYLISKRCNFNDEEIHINDGFLTISDFDALPFIACLGNAVTTISKTMLLEMERTMKIINKERNEINEQTAIESDLHRERRSNATESTNLQQSGGRPTARSIRQDGDEIYEGESSTTIYDFKNGWHADGENAQSGHGGDEENRIHYSADAQEGADNGYGGHYGENPSHEQPAFGSGGNSDERTGVQGEITNHPNSYTTYIYILIGIV